MALAPSATPKLMQLFNEALPQTDKRWMRILFKDYPRRSAKICVRKIALFA
jgi:hypothetical protein